MNVLQLIYPYFSKRSQLEQEWTKNDKNDMNLKIERSPDFTPQPT